MIEPAVRSKLGGVRPTTAKAVRVLPLPVSPTMALNWPRRTEKLTPCRTSRRSPEREVKPPLSPSIVRMSGANGGSTNPVASGGRRSVATADQVVIGDAVADQMQRRGQQEDSQAREKRDP